MYSLGTVLYELLENQKPFGDSLAARLDANGSLRFRRALGADLEKILAKALSRRARPPLFLGRALFRGPYALSER